MPFVTDDEIKEAYKGPKKTEQINPKTGDVVEKTAGDKTISAFFWGVVVCVISGIFFCFLMSPIPQKIALPANSQVQVVDDAGVIGDKSELETTLQNFQDKTGITVMVYLTNEETWSAEFDTLKAYAKSCYLNKFEDEKHWVVVYSDGTDGITIASCRGVGTSKLLKDKYVENFEIQLKKYLYNKSAYTAEQAFAKAFDETATNAMKVNAGGIVFLCILFGWAVITSIVLIIVNKEKWKEKHKNKQSKKTKTGKK